MITTILFGVVGAVVGLTFADIDIAPPIPLKHRSAWTHGPLIPALLLLLAGRYPAAWSFVVAFMATYAIHLLCDMFPRRWRGSALINLYPLPWSLPPLLSFLYLGLGVAGSVWVGARVLGYDLGVGGL